MVESFYRNNRDRYATEVKALERQLWILSLLRTILFSIAVAWTYFFFDAPTYLWPGLALTLGCFVALVVRHQHLKAKKQLKQEFVRINQTELNVLGRDFSQLPDGKEYGSPGHFFNLDLDLFGNASFFQYLNRTSTQEGKDYLASLLNSNDIESVKDKQEAIRELSKEATWRQEFNARANLLKTDSEPEKIREWINDYKSFLPSFAGFLPHLFGAASLAIIILVSLRMLPFSALTLWFFIGLGLVAIYLKKIQSLYLRSGKAKDLFKQYFELLKLLERKRFQSEHLKTRQEDIHTEAKKASELFRYFSRVLDALDQRNNMMMGIVLNGLLLWDIMQCWKIERWIEEYKEKVGSWFDAVAFFDAYNSLGNFDFNHPDYAYPEPGPADQLLSAEKLGHPMIEKSLLVANDFSIAKGEFHVITGANMAGKSTFLRSVSLAIEMANAGLPVCAKRFAYHPIKLISSMRTIDSLSDDSSYFYAEIKRLKFIVDRLKEEHYFVVLDEILKGTNSKDKEIGSKKFLLKLLQTGSMGIIATHDLSLCDLSMESKRVHNQYFEVGIEQDQLRFDYLLRDGICKTMNASFLLKKMDIV